MRLLCVIAVALALAPAAAATYPDDTVGGQLCADHGGVESQVTQGSNTIVVCMDGTTFLIREIPPPAPNVSYEPDPPPPVYCVEGFYDDGGWNEGDC